MSTDTSEFGLESLIVKQMTERGWLQGQAQDYDREYAVDFAQFTSFVQATQPDLIEGLALAEDGPTRRRFLSRLQGEITRRGIVDVLRRGIKDGPTEVDLYYARPSPGNVKAAELFDLNRFTVTRQLRYSRDETQLALDLAIFVNGLPVATFELKNSLTKQTVADAVQQYKQDRNSRELLFQLGRCLAHFAVDDREVHFCTQLKDGASWFLPFNKGYKNGAGNPPNPDGIMTDYFWKDVLSPASLADIVENFAQRTEERDLKSGRKTTKQIFPRYHQLDVVRRLLADAENNGAGQRYLIQHSAGSGKSNSITWLAHQLVGLQDADGEAFDSIIVVTDRVILDDQIQRNIKQYAQVGSIVGHADRSGDLRGFLASGKKIIITTVQKFPFVLEDIGDAHRGRRFAIIIDEAHSSQGGKTAAAMSQALAEAGEEDDGEATEDAINRLIEAKKMLPNASYFAFTATPKNKTLEIFGAVYEEDGDRKHRPFHTYSMKQAIDEGFILDVLANYTPVGSYYHLVKTSEDDPEFDAKKANRKLRRYVEGHDHAVRLKAEIMVDHFHESVIARQKIKGKARAMIVTDSIERAIQYFHAFKVYLAERKSPYKAIVAFSGEHEFRGESVTESSLNGFPSGKITERIIEDPYRFLICADKFQTGYDEPLLHTMYVDKTLAGVKAVQTLSRLNRAAPGKSDVFVLDFREQMDAIVEAFSRYYQTTLLARETDPNKLHDLSADLENAGVFTFEQVELVVELFLGSAERDRLDPVLDSCVAVYLELDEDEQVDFKSKAKTFVRTYNFLAPLLPYGQSDWEKFSIFLGFLVPKLPSPKEDDLSRGVLDSIDMDSYRVEKQGTMELILAEEDAEIDPVPTAAGGVVPEPEIDRLSNIIRGFNELFGDIAWSDRDRVMGVLFDDLPRATAADPSFQNAAKNNDAQNARIAHDAALTKAISALINDDMELFKQFQDNESFKRSVADKLFFLNYGDPERGGQMGLQPGAGTP